jgi:tetratricopeptide (TPR) repeat protein
MDVENGVHFVKVFVSSPIDVAPERGRVQAVAAKLNREYEGLVRFETVLWEEHFYKADRSFQPQIQQPDACDVLVSIFWTRVGTELPADFALMPDGKPYPSGTAYELLTALEASKTHGIPDVYVFRKTADAALPTADAERRRQAQTQLDALETFWSEWFKSDQGHFKAAFQTFGNTDEFEWQIEELLRQWLESHHLLGPRLRWPKEKGSPFPGLAPFEAEHAAVFFGRDRAIDEARRRFTAAAEQATPFLLIVGASGSGKSSLARAGLIPRLTTRGVVASVDIWRTAIIKPSEGRAGSVASLAMALFAALPELAQGDFPTAEALADHLRRGGTAAARPIVGALGRIAEAEQRERHSERPLRPGLVLLIDQLEEVFAQAVGDDERAAFAEAIKELLATGDIWCIATLRADLYELLLAQPVLKTLKESGASLDLGPPGAAELAEIVRASAAAAGLAYEHDAEHGALDERLLADAKTADSLPLLQFTLRQLYEQRVEANGETRLTHAAYEALGGLQGAIAAEAERAVANLPPGTLDALPRLLRRLAEPARDGKTFTLREVALADVTAEPAEAAVVQALLGARILIAHQDAAGRPTLRLAHDAVLTSWPKAAAAAQANRDFYRVRAEVEDALRRWQEHGQPKDRLIQRGVPLAEAEKLATDFAPELPANLVSYVNASRNHARVRQRLVAAAAVFFFALAVAATGASIWAYQEQQQAVRAQRQAEQTLAAATETANSLVFDLAQRFRDAMGVPAEVIKDILDKARALQEQLIKSGQVTPELKRSEGAALTETVDTLLTIGDTGGALAAAEQARQIYADLVAGNPGNAGWQRDLSVSNERLGAVQVAQGDLAGALTSYRDGLAIADRLAQSDPGNAGWQRDLAVSYNGVGDVQVTQDDLAGALKSYRDSLAIIDRLAQSDPGNAGWQRDLAISNERLGNVYIAQGNLAAALEQYRASLNRMIPIRDANPSNADLQRFTSVSVHKIGDVQVAQGDLAGALKSYRDSLAIFDRLAQSDPGNADWQHDLSVSDSRIGDVQVAQGDLAGALTSYRDGLAIADRLAQSDPGNAGWQRDLAVSYNEVGDVQVAQGDLAGALTSYRDGLAIADRLAQSDPGNAGWQRDLSVSLNKIGDVQDEIGEVHEAQNDLPAALTSYQASLAIAERLAQSDPDNADRQYDLSSKYDKVGDVQWALSDLQGALLSNRAALAIADRLAKSDPGNDDWQRSLEISYSKVGDVQLKQGDLSAALATFQAFFAIADRLAKSDPDNADGQRDLAMSYRKLASVYLQSKDTDRALAVLHLGKAIMDRLTKLSPDNADWKRELDWLDNKIAILAK